MYLFKFHWEVVSPREPSTNVQEAHLDTIQSLKEMMLQCFLGIFLPYVFILPVVLYTATY